MLGQKLREELLRAFLFQVFQELKRQRLGLPVPPVPDSPLPGFDLVRGAYIGMLASDQAADLAAGRTNVYRMAHPWAQGVAKALIEAGVTVPVQVHSVMPWEHTERGPLSGAMRRLTDVMRW